MASLDSDEMISLTQIDRWSLLGITLGCIGVWAGAIAYWVLR